MSVEPAITDPAGVPLFELSRAAWLAMVTMGPPDGGMGELTVTASGPLPVLAQMASAVACWSGDTATPSDCPRMCRRAVRAPDCINFPRSRGVKRLHLGARSPIT